MGDLTMDNTGFITLSNIQSIMLFCIIIVALILLGELLRNKIWQQKLRNLYSWYKRGDPMEPKHLFFQLFVVLSIFYILRLIMGDHLFRIIKVYF